MSHIPEYCLKPTYFIDSDHPEILAKTEEVIQGMETDVEKAVALYMYVRESIRYNPYNLSMVPGRYKASNIMNREPREGHCIYKSILLCALGRAAGIPTKLYFANVRNHIGDSKLTEKLGSNLMVFHGFMSFFLNGKWVKATPAFNQALCDKLGVAPLDFDGINDSIFQEYEGGGYMHYETMHGAFHDFPLDLCESEIRKHYGQLFETDYVELPGFEF